MKVEYTMTGETRVGDIVDHLERRGVSVTARYRRVVVDTVRNTATFFLWNPSGQLVGFQQYNPNGSKNCRNDVANSKYFTRVTHQENVTAVAVWGLEYFDLLEWDFLFVVEGVFDAVKVINAGFPCVAVLGCRGSDSVVSWLKTLSHKKIAIVDKDLAGKHLKKAVDVYHTVPDPFKDLGDMTQSDADEFLAGVVKSEFLHRRT